MGKYVVSVFLQVVEQLNSSGSWLNIHGANLGISAFFRRLLEREEVEALEVFLPPLEYTRHSELVATAQSILPAWRKGKGALRFYPQHMVEEIWADGAPRHLVSLDPEFWPTMRYMRDRFAVGPMPLSCQTHGTGNHSSHMPLHRIALAPPVVFDSLFCLSEETKQHYMRVFSSWLKSDAGHGVSRYDVVPNSVDIDKYCPVDTKGKAQAKRLLGIPEDSVLTLCLGRLSPATKSDLLPIIEGFANVSGSKDYLLIAGVENMPGYAEKLIQASNALGLGERVSIRTKVDHWVTPIFYQAADIFLFPSDNVQECLGNTSAEAAACGIPVLGSDWSGLKDNIVDGETGFRVPTYICPGLNRIGELTPISKFDEAMMLTSQAVYIDIEHLEDRWQTLLSDAELRQKMGAAGRRFVERAFSPKTVIDNVFRIWDEQMLGAKQETESNREKRKAAAYNLGFPVDYAQLYEPYATSVISANETSLRLTTFGKDVINRKAMVQLYDETMPLILPGAIEAILSYVGQISQPTFVWGEISLEVAKRLGQEAYQIDYVMTLLLKRGLFRLVE